MTKLIIFDWDDVFTLGSSQAYYQCYHETLRELGIELPVEEEWRRIRSQWGKPHREELRALLQEQPTYLDEACAIYERKFFGDVFVRHLSYVSGANELLVRLQERYTLAIATGAHPWLLRERVMPWFAIPTVFTKIISSYELPDVSYAKPHPYMVNEILTQTGITASETVLVGDAVTDMQMAQAAGVTPIAVLTGHLTRTAAEGLGIPYIIPQVTDLETVLDY